MTNPRLTIVRWIIWLAVPAFLVTNFLVATVVRHFIIEAFYIPTSAMEPTLIGSESHGDRILVSKLQLYLRPPKQWAVVVFKIDQFRIDLYRVGGQWPGVTKSANGTVRHPGNTKYVNYVKRIVVSDCLRGPAPAGAGLAPACKRPRRSSPRACRRSR